MTNSFRGGLLLMPISQGGSAAPRAMLIRRRRRYNFNMSKRLLDPPKLRNTGLEHCGFGFGNGRACSVCVSPVSNQTNSQIRQTSTLIPLLLLMATSNIAFPQDGQGRALFLRGESRA